MSSRERTRKPEIFSSRNICICQAVCTLSILTFNTTSRLRLSDIEIPFMDGVHRLFADSLL